MAANVQIQDDAGSPLTSSNYGAINASSNQAKKFRVQNVGNQNADSVQIYLQRLGGNDGLDFAQIAPDADGNPGTYGTANLVIGTMVPDAIVYFWVKATVGANVTPAGNPRQFSILVNYSGI